MAFEGLKLVATAKQDASDPASKRRQRLVMQIDHQLYMAEPENLARKFRGRWWTIGIDGKPTLAIKYGKIPLELAKGKHAIACADIAGVTDALQKARVAAVDGTFDSQLASVSEQVRARFKKGR
ncbi:hypothetical protein [Mesorhizobium japonicum]|uniref:Mlr4684 protein n=1 Tax=Mesorhizobium japonicum (strain LMG 29417 / CECT 9101 / MAFF 303099) TaxID=266835 RepID=Q98DI9_RHILO|nr:hypothetical protein [Mesorhizobium japonicum]BAB51282.1 mlr4684 [Mesorhizobium japonicum MAFF 303099]